MSKKIWILFCVIIFFKSTAMAEGNLSFEAFYANVTIIDAKNQNGGGAGMLLDLNSQLKAVLRGAYTFHEEEKYYSGREYDVTYTHSTFLAGIMYEPPVDFLSKFRFKWRNSFLCGYSHTEVKAEELRDFSSDDSGPAMALNTGLSYVYSQSYQFFVEAGLHHSFYRYEMDDSMISGVQLLAGVRYSLSDSISLGDY